ncbi:MAG: 1-(5-phosphoribosyl)-5-[(5-phosphoribosylamino)methylideneamino]imidazole-4-carboxamide isomerase [Leptolinea sp.]|jgi:phosphoribosylformimino-5-aminoimidazole carboxamide ribotide isomerase|nr:1-(5-phosphoribosyl)-5-[(5-phosphoribosylamino)methylideneamino]imidazole-4-carboxamide isomerase [Leptolinea sp.]
MTDFIIFPAIDLRNGQVVRLSQGDPNRQKIYSADPASVARSMLEQGAAWLHVVNLDAAFGEASEANWQALATILDTAKKYNGRVQCGGGLHSVEQVEVILSAGIDRAIIGSLAVRSPETVKRLLQKFGPERIAVSLDGRQKKVMVAGWQQASEIGVFELSRDLKEMGLSWLVYTDIERDGLQTGSDVETTTALARDTGLNIIASGGVCTPHEVKQLRDQGVAGAIIGRALYEATVCLPDLLEAARDKRK